MVSVGFMAMLSHIQASKSHAHVKHKQEDLELGAAGGEVPATCKA